MKLEAKSNNKTKASSGGREKLREKKSSWNRIINIIILGLKPGNNTE